MPENDATSSAAATLDPPVPDDRAASGGGGSPGDIPPPVEPAKGPEPAAKDEKPATAAKESRAETPPASGASAAAAAGPAQKTVFKGGVSTDELNVVEQQRKIEAHEYVEQQHQVNQYFDRQERLTVRSFLITDTSPVPELDEQASRARFAGTDEEGEALLLHLAERRVLLLSADHGARKATAGTYLGWRLRQSGSCRKPILLAESLERRVRVDFPLALKEPEFGDRVLIFRNAFSRGNPDLLALFERTDRTGWEQLGARLRERNTYLVFTARPDEVAPFRGTPAVQALHRVLAPHSRERVAGDFDSRLGELEARGDVAPALLAALREHRDALLGHFAFAGLLEEFVDFFVALNRPSLAPDEALRRFRDSSEWLLHNLDGDLEAWSFGFTLALAQCLRDAPPIAWLDFDRLHRHVARWLRRDAHLFPPVDGGGAARDEVDVRPSLSDESLLKRCHAEVVKDAASLADVVRFRGGGPPERLWEVMLDRHRRVLTAVLPRLRALAESEHEAEPSSLRTLAAQLIGRIGEIDPRRIVVPVVDEWVASPDRRRQAAIGALYQGVVASGRESYRRACFRHLQQLYADADEDGNARLVAVIAAYARIGEYDLVLAMRELGAIAREHLAPLIGDVGRLSRLMASVESKFEEQPSAGEEVALLLVHALLRELIFRIYNQRGGALLALQLALTLLCRRTEPIRVFGALRAWIAGGGGWTTGALVALMFLNEGGIATGVAEARDEDGAPGNGAGVSRNPFVLSLAAGEDEVDQMAGFLGDLYESVSKPFAAAPDLKRVCRESLLAHLTRWVRDALPVPGHLAAMQRLFESLGRTHRGILREPLQQLLARQEFSRSDGELHAFAHSLTL